MKSSRLAARRFAFLLCAVYTIALSMSTLPSPASAGPNAGGAITLHWNPAIPYTSEPQDFDGALSDCASSVVKAPAVSSVPPPEDEMRIWFAYAVFPPGSLPRLLGVSFGIQFSPMFGEHGLSILWSRRPPETVEFPTPGWPQQAGSGNVLVFKHAQTNPAVQLYLFAGYATDGQYFSLRKHPTIASQFADDTIPPVIDDIADFGTLGFGVEGRQACPAPALGACCFSDGRCLDLSPAGCLEQGGTYQGDDTLCAQVACPQPRGACCFTNGNCEMQPEGACAEYGGTWLGLDVDCAPNPCPQPAPLGTCCFEDTHCIITSETECPTGNWTPGQACTPNPCPGACCNLLDGTCRLRAEIACHGNEHQWVPIDHCEPNSCLGLGAPCCLLDGTCVIVFEVDCPTHYWQPGIPCAPNPCPPGPTGACCSLWDATCVIATETMCSHLGDGHSWEGPETTCDPSPCDVLPLGACCQSYGGCRMGPQILCHDAWYEGVPCDPNPCVSWGACCDSYGDCSQIEEDFCRHGIWQRGVPCEPNPCVVPSGACCAPDGSCTYTLHRDCPVRWYEDELCDPNPCSPIVGACCHPDGTCSYVQEPECDGTWYDPPQICDFTLCPQPVGACCLPSGECTMTTEPDCTETQLGTYMGNSVPCNPYPCATPTQTTTWGKIKARFR